MQVQRRLQRRRSQLVPCALTVAAVALAACTARTTMASIAGFVHCSRTGVAQHVRLRRSGRSSIQMLAASDAEAEFDSFDPWSVLELPPGVGQDEAKRKYKKMITKYHPDVDPSPEAEKRLSRIVRAYAVISGEDKTLDMATLLKNAVQNFRTDLKKARLEYDIEEDAEKILEVQRRLAAAQEQKAAVELQSTTLGGAVLGAIAAGPTGAMVGAVAGLAFKDNDDAAGRFVKGTGNLAKLVVEGLGSAVLRAFALALTEESTVDKTPEEEEIETPVASEATREDIKIELGPLTAGKKVVVVGTHAFAGKQGTVVGEALGGSFAVQFESGSVFNMPMEYIQHASSASATPSALKGQKVVALGPPAMAGKQGTIIGLALGDSLAVKFESGSTFNIPMENIEEASAAPSASAAVTAATTEDKHLEFTSGQNVFILGPPGIAGSQGTVVGPAPGDSVAVRLESGSIFNLPKWYIQAAEGKQLEFTFGQNVVILGPPAVAGQQGTVVGPAPGDCFEVEFESGSIFDIPVEYILDASAASAAPAAVSEATGTQVASETAKVATTDDKQLEFTSGQNVVILGPPSIAGNQGTVVGPAPGDSFAVKLESGSIFNIAKKNIKDVSAPLEFTFGQNVVILGPPSIAGNMGTVVGPAPGDSFAVRLESGSVFNIAKEKIKDASAALEFTFGQKVVILGPPPEVGNQGTIVGPAPGDSFAVKFESGSVFNIAKENIKARAEVGGTTVPKGGLLEPADPLGFIDEKKRADVEQGISSQQ